jgi:hypothetical protein
MSITLLPNDSCFVILLLIRSPPEKWRVLIRLAEEPAMATAADILRGTVILVLVPLTFALLTITYKLYRVYRTERRSEYAKNRARTPSLGAVVRGEAPSFYDGVRDERVAAGIAIDTTTNHWVEQGRLSEEAISSVLR